MSSYVLSSDDFTESLLTNFKPVIDETLKQFSTLPQPSPEKTKIPPMVIFGVLFFAVKVLIMRQVTKGAK